MALAVVGYIKIRLKEVLFEQIMLYFSEYHQPRYRTKTYFKSTSQINAIGIAACEINLQVSSNSLLFSRSPTLLLLQTGVYHYIAG